MTRFEFTSTPQEQPAKQRSPSRNQEVIAAIGGLQYVENYINEHQHDWLLTEIDKNRIKKARSPDRAS